MRPSPTGPLCMYTGEADTDTPTDGRVGMWVGSGNTGLGREGSTLPWTPRTLPCPRGRGLQPRAQEDASRLLQALLPSRRPGD